MKKAYNEVWVENLHLLEQADAWLDKKLITPEQHNEVEKAFPAPFYRPEIFVKIGLFIFTLIACSFASGFLTLFLIGNDSQMGISIVSLICLAGFIFFLENMIPKRRLYHSGVDNALLYAAIAAFAMFFFTMFDKLLIWQYCLVMLLIFLAATWRYADRLTAAAAFFTLLFWLGHGMMQFALGKALIPFAVMILSAAVYFTIIKDKSTYYHDCRTLVKVLTLCTFYLGGNYFVVREGNALLNDLNLPYAPQIAFAPLFYIFTVCIPLLYIVFGIRQKDRMLFIVGLLAFAFSVYTYKHYFSPLTVAQGLAIAGLLMLIGSIALIKYLHQPRHGVSDEQEGKRKLANLEALLAAQQLGQSHQETGNVAFGGGNFGGGGAGETY